MSEKLNRIYICDKNGPFLYSSEPETTQITRHGYFFPMSDTPKTKESTMSTELNLEEIRRRCDRRCDQIQKADDEAIDRGEAHGNYGETWAEAVLYCGSLLTHVYNPRTKLSCKTFCCEPHQKEIERLRDWQARAAYVFQLMMRRTINPRHTLTITEIEHLEHFPRELLSELEGGK